MGTVTRGRQERGTHNSERENIFFNRIIIVKGKLKIKKEKKRSMDTRHDSRPDPTRPEGEDGTWELQLPPQSKEKFVIIIFQPIRKKKISFFFWQTDRRKENVGPTKDLEQWTHKRFFIEKMEKPNFIKELQVQHSIG